MSFTATQPHTLALLPPQITFSDAVNNALLEARVEIAELKGYSFSLNNPLLLLSPAVVKEAVASSEIENIHTTIIDVLENQLFAEEEQSLPNKEVLRYREGLLGGYKKLGSLGISTRMVRDIHRKLLPQEEGQYRRLQNAITEGANSIRYTPPLQSKISELMGNLENFLNDSKIDPLLKAIIGHYQFEAIHPFSDGNGRTGRILMILGLTHDELLDSPILFISGYINQNKNEYYQHLLEVTSKGEWEKYILFMLKGFQKQAAATKQLALQVKNTYFDLKKILKESHSNVYSSDLLEALFTFPVINPSKLSEELKVHRTTASRYLQELEQAGILERKSIGTYILYANVPLLKVLHQ